jgi:probable H4MPT-linked C1 transfer pathway protein
MTGELCDNFASRADGVREILDVVTEVLGAQQTRVYAGTHGWYDLDSIQALTPEWVASANWHAMAAALALAYDDAVLIDIGSTTTDIIPISQGLVVSRGNDDASRLTVDELVYSGVVRTPLMSICDRVPVAGNWQRLAAEHFASTADIYRILGELPEEVDLYDTADGAPKTSAASARRIGRMLGTDVSTVTTTLRGVAQYFAYCQFDEIQRAFMAVRSRAGQQCNTLVGAGAGAFIVERIARFNDMDFVQYSALFDVVSELRKTVSTCAPAAAVAQLLWRDL